MDLGVESVGGVDFLLGNVVSADLDSAALASLGVVADLGALGLLVAGGGHTFLHNVVLLGADILLLSLITSGVGSDSSVRGIGIVLNLGGTTTVSIVSCGYSGVSKGAVRAISDLELDGLAGGEEGGDGNGSHNFNFIVINYWGFLKGAERGIVWVFFRNRE